MKIQCTMYLPSQNRNNFGHITVSNSGIILARKNKFLALGFGLLGALLTQAKDFHRLQWIEVSSIQMKKFKLNKRACYITLKDDNEYVFLLPKPDMNIPLLQEQFRQSQNRTVTKSIFSD